MLALAALAGAGLLAWLVLLGARGWFWSTDPRLVDRSPAPDWPTVAVVMPARNEAAQLPLSLPCLFAQDYRGELRVVVVDDGSSDATEAVARELADGASRACTVVRGRQLPAGWVGKVWALQQGVSVAGEPEFVLFCDADVALGRDVVRRLVGIARADRRDMVSVMARLPVTGRWPGWVVPAFVYLFRLLYPFRWVASGRRAAAAGGCLLVRRRLLDAAGGIAGIRAERIDDIALAGRLHAAGGRLWLGFCPDVRAIRPYRGFGELWRMVARNAYTQLRYSPVRLALTLVGLLLLFGTPVLGVVAGALALGLHGGGAAVCALALGAAAWLVQAASYLPTLRYFGVAGARALGLPFVGLLYGAMTLGSALDHVRGRSGWRGRTLLVTRRG